MKYYLFALKFLTPVHFGNGAGGGKLENVDLYYNADTLFSAIITEAAKIGADYQSIIDGIKNRSVVLSSLAPYYLNAGSKDLELYLPKPFIRGKSIFDCSKSYEEVKKEATKMKSLKKSGFVKANELAPYVNALRKGEKFECSAQSFTEKNVVVRVNMREAQPLPYYVGYHVFASRAGMYFVVGLETPGFLPEFTRIVTSLGYEGIGGKRSSGYGKFELLKKPGELAILSKADGKALSELLQEQQGNIYISLAPVSPVPGQEAIIQSGFYKLKPSSGFSDLGRQGNVVKRNTFYMLAEGSAFDQKISGELKTITIDGLDHSVFRNGMGLFAGVKFND